MKPTPEMDKITMDAMAFLELAERNYIAICVKNLDDIQRAIFLSLYGDGIPSEKIHGVMDVLASFIAKKKA